MDKKMDESTKQDELIRVTARVLKLEKAWDVVAEDIATIKLSINTQQASTIAEQVERLLILMDGLSIQILVGLEN